MKYAALHSALRELRTHMSNPVRGLALAGIAIILTLLAPFDTGDALRPLPRFLYWASLTGCGYVIGYAGHQTADHRAPDAGPLARSLIAAPVTSLGIFALVLGLNAGFLGIRPDLREALRLFPYVLAIASVVAVIMQFAYAQTPPADATPPRILDRLPFDKRGALISLSAEDHYIRIATTKGEALVLLRLSDAMREVGALRGLQVHRSHWIALDQVASVSRRKDRAILQMRDGRTIPASRTYLPALRDAGLLPRGSDG